MTINYTNNTYVKVGNYSNIVAEFTKSRTYEDAAPTLCEFMKPLISKLSLMHPEWTIVGVRPTYSSGSNSYPLHSFAVYVGDEMIGDIWRDGYYESTYKYALNNKRVEVSRVKHGAMRTKDVKKALKAVEQFFTPQSTGERRDKAVRETSSHIGNTVWRTTRQLSEIVMELAPAMASYITNNMGEIRPILMSLGAPASALDALPDRANICRGMEQVQTSRDAKAGTTVVLMGDRYMLIHDAAPGEMQIVTASQLDPAMAGKIGLLKLFDRSDEAFEDVGMRIDNTTFYVVG